MLSLLPPCPRLFLVVFSERLSATCSAFECSACAYQSTTRSSLGWAARSAGASLALPHAVRMFELVAVAGCSALLHLLPARRRFVSGSDSHDILIPRKSMDTLLLRVIVCCAQRPKYVKVYASPQRVPPR